jgi:hypothetical protein
MTYGTDHEKREQEQLFRTGLAAGLAGKEEMRPAVSAPTAPGDTELTTLRSAWLHRRCPVCGHSFRPGDRVRRTPAGETVHVMPGLCLSEETQPADEAQGNSPEQEAFFAGLEAACPVPDDVQVRRLTPGHPLLAPPMPGLLRHACRVCGRTFRPGELVVICPCAPNAPHCQAAVHRDHIRQLWCWDEWHREEQERKALAQAKSGRSDDRCLALS